MLDRLSFKLDVDIVDMLVYIHIVAKGLLML